MMPRGYEANHRRMLRAGDRDEQTAKRILEADGKTVTLSVRQVELLSARIRYKTVPWSELAAQLGMTRSAAYGIWRTLMLRQDIRDLLELDANGGR